MSSFVLFGLYTLYSGHINVVFVQQLQVFLSSRTLQTQFEIWQVRFRDSILNIVKLICLVLIYLKSLAIVMQKCNYQYDTCKVLFQQYIKINRSTIISIFLCLLVYVKFSNESKSEIVIIPRNLHQCCLCKGKFH